MDVNSISEHSIEKFVRKIFNSDSNFKSLTKADLRNKYMEEKGIAEFSFEEKKLFSSVINEVFEEILDSTETSNASCDSKRRPGNPKGAATKHKIVNSDDERDSGVFESEHNKENVESFEINKNSTAENGNYSGDDMSETGDSDASHASKSEIKLDDMKELDNAKSDDTQHDNVKTQCSASSEADTSEDDFVVKKSQKKGKTQHLNSSYCNSDSESNSDAESNNSVQEKTAIAKKQKKVPQEKREKANEKQKMPDSDSSDSDQSLTSNEDKKSKKKSKLETSKRRKTEKPLNPKHQNESDVSSEDENKPDLQEEKTNRKSKKSKSGEAPKKSKNKRKMPDTDSSDSNQSLTSNENKKSKKKSKLETSKRRKTEKPLNPKHQNESGVSSADENEPDLQEEKTNRKSKKSKSDEAPKKSKNSPPNNSRIEHLKKYLRAAGLRIQSYNKLFESCRSQKAKTEKILEVLQNAGMKGRPTLEKCKKLKKKIEEKKDIESLDLTNIIETEGRPRRNANRLHPNLPAMKTTEVLPIDHFSSLKDIVDSDESDTPVKPFSRIKTLIQDDDDSS